MAIALVQQKQAAGDGTTFTITLDSTPTEGNVLFAFITHDGSGLTSSNSGWTEIDDRTGSSFNLVRQAAYWKVAGASEATAHEWGDGDEKWTGVIYELSGVDTSTPVHGTPLFDDGDDTSPISPSFTPSVSGVFVMAGAGNNNLTTFTPDSGLSNTWSQGSSGGGACTSGGGTELRADTTATGTYTHTLGDSLEWISYTVAANPEAAAEDITLDAASASFPVTAAAVDLEIGYQLNADTSSFAVTVADVLLEHGYSLAADSAAVAITAAAVSLDYAAGLDADSASFAITAATVGLEQGHQLNAESTSIAVTAASIALEKGKTLDIGSAAFAVTPAAVAFNRTYVLGAESAAVNITAAPVSLEFNSEEEQYTGGETKHRPFETVSDRLKRKRKEERQEAFIEKVLETPEKTEKQTDQLDSLEDQDQTEEIESLKAQADDIQAGIQSIQEQRDKKKAEAAKIKEEELAAELEIQKTEEDIVTVLMMLIA
jgi:hypothetical protein